MTDMVPAEELVKWNRWFAVECNNSAWRLAESHARTAAQDDEMLHCAHAAALHWSKVGTDLHCARATMLVGHVYALLGDGQRASTHARKAYDYVMSHESPDWEVAFAHAVLANAAAASGDRPLHAVHYAAAEELGSALENAEERSIFEATFAVVPAPV